MNLKKTMLLLLCGLLGCLCFGGGDWLMVYNTDLTASGSLYWLTDGVAAIAPWRNALAMALSFPGILLYGVALLGVSPLICAERERRIYRLLHFFGLTPWLCLHLLYIMILYLFAWMHGNGYADAALPACEALFAHLGWIVFVSEALMLPPFLYWFYLQAAGKTVFPRAAALTNVLVIYAVLYGFKTMLPDVPFRLGFTNGLMSESMVIWFSVVYLWGSRLARRQEALS